MESLVPVLRLGGGLLGLGLSLGLLFPSTWLAAHAILTGSLHLPSLEWEMKSLLWLTGDDIVVRFSWHSYSISISVRRASIELEGDPSDEDPELMSGWLVKKRGRSQAWLAHLTGLIPLPRLVLQSPRLEFTIQTDFGALSAVVESLHLRYRHPSDVEVTCSIRVMGTGVAEGSLPLLEVTDLHLRTSPASSSMEIEDCLLFPECLAAPEVLLPLRTIIIKILSVVTSRQLLNPELQEVDDADPSAPFFDAHTSTDAQRLPFRWTVDLKRFSLSHHLSGAIRKSLSMQNVSCHFNFEMGDDPKSDCRLSIAGLVVDEQEPLLSQGDGRKAADVLELSYAANSESVTVTGTLRPCSIAIELSTIRAAIAISNMIAGTQALLISPQPMIRKQRVDPALIVDFECSQMRCVIKSSIKGEQVHIDVCNFICTDLSNSSLSFKLDSLNAGTVCEKSSFPFLEVASISGTMAFTTPIPFSTERLYQCESAQDWMSLQDAATSSCHTSVNVQVLTLRLTATMLSTISEIVNGLLTTNDRRTGLIPLRMNLSDLRPWSAKFVIAEMSANMRSTDPALTELCITLGGACTILTKGVGNLSRAVDVYLSNGSVDVLGRSAQTVDLVVASFELRDSCLLRSLHYPAEAFFQSAAYPNHLIGLIRQSSTIYIDVVSVKLNLLSLFLNPIVQILMRSLVSFPTAIPPQASLLASSIVSFQVSLGKLLIIFSRNREFGCFTADTCRLNTVSHGPFLFLSLFHVKNAVYMDTFYADSKFRVLLSPIDVNSDVPIEVMYISHPCAPSFLAVKLSHVRFVYLQRAMMTFVSFLQELFRDTNTLDEKNTADLLESLAFLPQLSPKIQIMGKLIEFIIPVNSYSNEGLVIIAETVNLWLSGSGIDSGSEGLSDSEGVDILLKLCEEVMYSSHDNYSEYNFPRFDEITKCTRSVNSASHSEISNFEYNISNATICSLCNQNAIAAGLSLGGMFSVVKQCAMSEGFYISVEKSLGFRYHDGENHELSTVTVEVRADPVELVMAQGQYMVRLNNLFHFVKLIFAGHYFDDSAKLRGVRREFMRSSLRHVRSKNPARRGIVWTESDGGKHARATTLQCDDFTYSGEFKSSRE